MNTKSKYLVMIPFGAPGTGKSTICNFLIDGKDSGRFKSSKTTQGGETKYITFATGYALNDTNNPKIKIFDVPGLGDPELPIEAFAKEIKLSIPEKEKIDMALIVIKYQDYRMSLEQIIVCETIKYFVDNLNPKNILLLISHCDSVIPTNDFIKDKLKSFEKYSNLVIPKDNVIIFKNNKDSLKEFVNKFVEGNGKINENLNERVIDISKRIPKIVNRIEEEEIYGWQFTPSRTDNRIILYKGRPGDCYIL